MSLLCATNRSVIAIANSNFIHFCIAPSVFEVVLAAVRPIFSQRTRDALKILGTNKQ